MNTIATPLVTSISEAMSVTMAVYAGDGALLTAVGPERAIVPSRADAQGAVAHTMATALPVVVDGRPDHPYLPIRAGAAEFYMPLVVDNEVIGAVGLLTTDPTRSRELIEKRAVTLQLLRQVAEGVATRLTARGLQEAVRQLRGQLGHLIGAVDQPAILVAPDLTVMSCNAGGAQVAQRPIRECVNKRLDELLPQALVEACRSRHPHAGLELGEWLCDTLPIAERGQASGTLLVFTKPAEGQHGRRTPVRSPRFTLDDLRGSNAALVAVKEMARKVAPTDASVLIRGESGTGKELFARAVHAESGRKGAFVALNCAAVPEHLLESELFGYEDGAFTGAKKGGKPGKFELANGGTLFLDEIGDIPLALQAKLLRVLQFKEVERVGGTQPIPVQFRLVTATHRPLEEMIADGRFRSDLYYRINVIVLEIPSLRERKDDLYMLLELFTKSLALRTGQPVKRWTAEALNVIFAYPWPGNVRELENMVEHAWLVETGDMFHISSLPTLIRHWAQPAGSRPAEAPARPVRPTAAAQGGAPGDGAVPRHDAHRGGADELMLAVLAKHGMTTKGKEAAAKELGMSRATLYRRLKNLGAS